MYKNVLLAFCRQDTALRGEIEEQALSGLQDADGRTVSVHVARDQQDALSKAAQLDLHFVVVGHSLARDTRSPVEESGGIHLCKAIRSRGIVSPILLLVPHVNVLTNSLLDICRQLEVSPYNTAPDVLALIREQVRLYSPPGRTLEIVLRRIDAARWDYELHGNNFRFFRNGPLQVRSLDILSDMSRAIGREEGASWFKSFQTLGRELRSILCDSTKFGVDLAIGLELAGGIERARISFSMGSVDRTHYPIALEALYPPREYPEVPWMLRAPLSRSVWSDQPLPRPLLGKGSPPLNVLLVSAGTHGFVNDLVDFEGRSLSLNPLRMAERECLGLERFMLPHQRDGAIQTLKRLPRLSEGILTRQSLLSALDSQEWTIVHFAGHSFAREDGDRESRGYIFVGPPEKPEAIAIEEIAPSLSRCTMVYLSSCESMSPAFAIELARHGVPIVIGFRWKVDDSFATLHAHLFYRFLLREKAVERAFLRARMAIHRHYSNRDRVWASSMLLFGNSR